MNADTDLDLDLVVSAHRRLGSLALERGDVDAVEAAVRTVLDLDAHPPPYTVDWAIWCRMWTGHFREAVELGTRYADLRADPAAVLLWSNPVEGIVWALFATGEWDRCWSLGNVLTDVLPSTKIAASTQMLMAQLAAARGEMVEARQLLGLARAVIAPTEGPTLSLDYTAPLAAAEGLVSFAEGDVESALQILKAVLVDGDIAHRSFDVYEVLLVAARALSSLAPEARTWEELISDAAARVVPVGPLGAAWKSEVACRLADRQKEPDCSAWAGVVAAWRAVGHVYYRAIAQVAYAESLVRVGDRDAAATEIFEGLATAESLGALPLAEQFRKLARSARIKLEDAEPNSAASPADYLTGREREVLGLVALGRTNSQIATELFMSPKTASVHVSRIITKLGVSNRTEAAAYAHRHGFADV